MIDIYLSNFNELYVRLTGFPDAVNSALAVKSQLLVDDLARNVKDNKLSGEALNVKTGLLRDSIATEVGSGDEGLSASVYVDGDVPYAAIQEYGGQTKAHIIEATKGRALAFNWSGKQSFFAHINHPGSAIPERSYLRSALAENEDAIVSGFGDVLSDVIRS